jgi:hypothetical protein
MRASMRETVPSTAKSARAAKFAALTLGKLHVLLAQNEIRTIEATTDVLTASPPPRGVGWIEVDRDRLPVYCTGPDLAPMSVIPAERRICVVLKSDVESFGLLCDEVVLATANIAITDMPVAMRLPGTPIVGLARYADAIACVCKAQHLSEFLRASQRLGGGRSLPASKDRV